jgi:glycosyltransferase involved in cell wall biosynthesis
MTLSPIVLFVYNRPWHTRQTVKALQKNELADRSDLFIYSDSPKDEQTEKAVQKVREYIHTIDGFKTVTIREREENMGLAGSIIDGVTAVVNEYGRVIVLEDDLVTSPFFLRYMNDALNLYKCEEKVISIHGYIYPLSEKLPSTFFLRGADCWGWATWKRGWDLLEGDGQKLLNELEEKRLARLFDFNEAYGYTQMLRDQIAGKNNSWAVRWYASAFLRERFTLYPGISLIQNIGFDRASTHCGTSDVFDVKLPQEPISVRPIDIIENLEARKAIEDYFRSLKPSPERRILRSIKNYLNNVIKNLKR